MGSCLLPDRQETMAAAFFYLFSFIFYFLSSNFCLLSPPFGSGRSAPAQILHHLVYGLNPVRLPRIAAAEDQSIVLVPGHCVDKGLRDTVRYFSLITFLQAPVTM